MENEIATEVRFDLSASKSPTQVLIEAKEAAKALESVISQRKNAVKFNGRQYLQFEDWQTCGKFYGVTAKIVNTEYVEINGAKGFLARAEAIRMSDGAVISAAESMCLSDEKNWESKPLFQLRSMSQTRAGAKCLRNCLAWVVVLAGFEPSVAEEMTGDENTEPKPAIAEPQRKEPKPEENIGSLISEAQGRMLYAKWKTAKIPDDQVKAYIKSKFGVESTKLLKKADLDSVLAWIAQETVS